MNRASGSSEPNAPHKCDPTPRQVRICPGNRRGCPPSGVGVGQQSHQRGIHALHTIHVNIVVGTDRYLGQVMDTMVITKAVPQPTTPPDDSGDGDSLNEGEIAAIVIFTLLGAAFLGVGGRCCCCYTSSFFPCSNNSLLQAFVYFHYFRKASVPMALTESGARQSADTRRDQPNVMRQTLM